VPFGTSWNFLPSLAGLLQTSPLIKCMKLIPRSFLPTYCLHVVGGNKSHNSCLPPFMTRVFFSLKFVPENVGLNKKVICLHRPSLEEQTKRSVVIEIFYKERCRSLLNLSFPTGLLGRN
jgi:hypothetical protein